MDTFKKPAPKRRKPNPPASGGLDLLDSIFGGMDKLASAPSKHTTAKFLAEDQLEVASHYQMVRAAPLTAGPMAARVCRNPDCGETEMENDYRSGDRVCRSCGAVQNARSVESQEEEHRTFADDDKKESKQRTSRVDGNGGGGVGNVNLKGVHKLAAGQADSGDGLSDKEVKRLEKIKEKVSTLADHMQLQDHIKRDGQNLCQDLAMRVHEHDANCGRPGQCRLTLRMKSAAVVAAALLKEALRKNGTDRLFEELKAVLKGDDVDAANARNVGRCTVICQDLLKGSPFPCAGSASRTGRASGCPRCSRALSPRSPC